MKIKANITKKDISKSIYTKFGTSEKIISIFIDDLFKTFKKILKKDDKLILKNIGSFKILEKKQRIGRNPKTGQIYPISKRKTISFKMSENIKDKINNE
ncbi:MAG: integration host factor subunit alpha [Candidatus Pelagibacter sp.]|nr:integration host factor subunit alpha [Candidatus Pelagibacter sp.]|tara:strand:+ start:1360 stop:1656 length:297 start_codon:yes stop_codon:yes gene_type:complete